jgi:hypothetical protein
MLMGSSSSMTIAFMAAESGGWQAQLAYRQQEEQQQLVEQRLSETERSGKCVKTRGCCRRTSCLNG